MDHPTGVEAQDDYLTMDQMGGQDEYLSMNQMGAQDEYTSMDQMPPAISDPDYLMMDKGYEDPLIADYLTMDEMTNSQKFDDYPTNERLPGEIVKPNLFNQFFQLHFDSMTKSR
jgi:hypothetical protein